MSLSTIAAGTFSFRRTVEQAYREAINAAARSDDSRAAAPLRQEMQERLSEAEDYDSSHHTIRLQVNAKSATGNKKGWVRVQTRLLVKCVAPHDLGRQLQQQHLN
jgi:hypothetical protein